MKKTRSDMKKKLGAEEYEKHIRASPDYDKTMQLMKDWENYQEHGTRYVPETDLTRRKAYMSKRYTGSPSGGFSGALGGASVQKKKLLGA